MKKQIDYRVISIMTGDWDDDKEEYVYGEEDKEWLEGHREGCHDGNFYAKIKELMNEGWVCVGGFNMDRDYQTMVKYGD